MYIDLNSPNALNNIEDINLKQLIKELSFKRNYRL